MRHYTTRLENVGEKKYTLQYSRRIGEKTLDLILFNRTQGQTSEQLPLVRHKTVTRCPAIHYGGPSKSINESRFSERSELLSADMIEEILLCHSLRHRRQLLR